MILRDLKRALFSVGMLLSVIIGLILLFEPVLHDFLASLKYGVSGDYINFFFSSLALGGYLIFTPLMTVLPATITFCDELNTGYVKYILVRKKQNRYILSRMTANALAGGIATALPLLLLAVLMLPVTGPYTIERLESGSFSPLHQTIFADIELVWGGYLCVLVIVLLGFVFGVVWSTLGLGISALIPNRYVALCAPFILFFALHIGCNALGLYEFTPANTILPDILPSFWFLAVYQLVLLVTGVLLSWFAVKRRLADV